MWVLKIIPLLIALSLTACRSPVIVEMAVLPTTPATAKIKQLSGKVTDQNPSSCPLPCSVTVEASSNYEVSFDAPGYYPAVVEFDWDTAWQTSNLLTVARGWSTSAGVHRVPLIIPLIQRKVVKN
jgi:hypothetical protein